MLEYTRREVDRGVGALVVLHDLNLASRFCDRLVVLQAGHVVAQGTPSQVLTEALVSRVYGTRVDVHTIGARPLVVPHLPDGARAADP